MGFEFDPEKDAINRAKHGYGLQSGSDLFESLVWPIEAAPPVAGLAQYGRTDGEPRFRVLTLDHECLLVDFVFIVRGEPGADYRARAISYRRAYEADFIALFGSHVTLEECLAWHAHCVDAGRVPQGAWPHSPLLEPRRANYLARSVGFAGLLTESIVRGDIDITELSVEPADDPDAPGFSRATASLVDSQGRAECVLDYFFNGSRGIRFYFSLAPMIGYLFNRRVVKAITQCIAGCLRERGNSMAEQSFLGATAKVWPRESDLHLERPDEACPLILSPSWLHVYESWQRSGGATGNYRACWGIQAPQPRPLVLKGDFVDSADREWLSGAKLRRSEEIHALGWS